MKETGQKQLKSGLVALGLSLPEFAQEQMLSLLELLKQWNRVHNLTAVRRFEDMIDRHLLDSLVALPYLKSAKRVCDVGTGAGFPGLPLAIALPEVEFVLLDSSLKKIQFVQQVILTLGLKRVTAVHTRVEQYDAGLGFDWVLSRAVASLGAFVELAGHLATQNGSLLAWKANLEPSEQNSMPASHRITQIKPVKVPYDAKNRVLVFMDSIDHGA
jgi:16S rRNA (guanine527-N7)-methyltransferase